MCLAIFQTAGNSIPEDYLRTGFESNPHGAGYMYFDNDNILCIEKCMDFEEFIESYEKNWLQYGGVSPFAIHFRWATHGTRDISNVHPFAMNDNVAVMHNGILDCHIDDTAMSDTASFVKNYLAALPTNWYDNDYLFDMVEQYCEGSKLIVFSNEVDAEYPAYILNESSGHWKNGVWYSNGSYEKTKSLYTWSIAKSAKQSAIVFENENAINLSKCELCDSLEMMDALCYACGTCNMCFMPDSECMCDGIDVHSMTDEQFTAYNVR